VTRFTPFELPARMRAAISRGARQVVSIAEVPVPPLAPGRVMVLVMAASASGTDASGVVWRVGDGVTRWKEGDEIVTAPALPCGQCSACTGFGRGGCERPTRWTFGLAELLVVTSEQLVRKPRHLSWEEAAMYGSAFFTAYRGLVDRAKVRPGEGVVVWGGGRPLGIAAIQLARLLGANVVSIDDDDEHAAVAASLGATALVRKTSRARVDVLGALGGVAPQVVLDAPPGTLGASLSLVGRRGRVVATHDHGETPIDGGDIFRNEKSVIGVGLPSGEECQRANELVHQGKIAAVARRVVSLDEADGAARADARHEEPGATAVLVAAPRVGLKTLGESTTT
jgi:crotonyl-CoA carboxylase/reductase